MTIQVKAYVVIQGKKEYNRWSAKVHAVYQTKPTALPPNGEVMELLIELPDDYFTESTPQIKVAVPSTPKAAVTTTAKVTKGRSPSAAAAVIAP